MKPSEFNYYAVDSIDAAISLIAQHGEEARFLAGGQSLVPMMNFRVAAPSALIDLNGVPELSNVRIDDDGALHIGAMATRQLETDPEIAEANPLIAVAAAYVAHTQIQKPAAPSAAASHTPIRQRNCRALHWSAMLKFTYADYPVRASSRPPNFSTEYSRQHSRMAN